MKRIAQWMWSYRRPVRVLAAYQAMLLVVATAICLVQGRLTTATLGTTLVYLSIGLITFSIMSGVGGLFSTHTFEYQFVSTISRDILDNQRHAQAEKRAAFTFITNTLVICGISAMIGLFVASL